MNILNKKIIKNKYEIEYDIFGLNASHIRDIVEKSGEIDFYLFGYEYFQLGQCVKDLIGNQGRNNENELFFEFFGIRITYFAARN